MRLRESVWLGLRWGLYGATALYIALPTLLSGAWWLERHSAPPLLAAAVATAVAVVAGATAVGALLRLAPRVWAVVCAATGAVAAGLTGALVGGWLSYVYVMDRSDPCGLEFLAVVIVGGASGLSSLLLGLVLGCVQRRAVRYRLPASS